MVNVGNLKSRYASVITVFRGIGQIMLQENAMTGFLFWLGILVFSGVMGTALLLASIVGTITAKLLNFDDENLKSGLYGFSAALVGVALTLFFQSSVLLWCILLVGAILAAILQHFFIVRKIPVFTLPFVLVTWLLVYLIKQFDLAELAVAQPQELEKQVNVFAFTIRGYGQVIFQDNFIIGLIFYIAVAISSNFAAVFGIFASFISGYLALQFGVPEQEVMAGLFGYNAVLCAIVFAGKQFSNVLWALVSVILSLIIAVIFHHYQLMQLTFPFVAATCLTLYIQKLVSKEKVIG